MLTLQSLKDYLRVSGTGRDAGLQLIVNSINAKVPTLTRRDWQHVTRTEKRRGNGTAALVLRHMPATSLTSLTVNGEAVDVSDEGAVTLDAERGIVTLEDGRVFPENARIVVVYVGGPDGWPADLVGAALEMAAYCYNTKGGMQSVKGVSGGHSLVDSALEYLPAVRGTIQYHTDNIAGYLT